MLPGLPAFLERHPGLTLHIGEGDRFVDIVREGYDCVIRAGEIADSDMMVRRLGLAHEATFASPDYLARRGVPRTIDDLQGHEMIGFASSRTGQVLPLEFTVGNALRTVTLPARITVTNSETYGALARMGYGLIQAPRHGYYARDLAAGTLVELLLRPPPIPNPRSPCSTPRAANSPPPRVRGVHQHLAGWRRAAPRL